MISHHFHLGISLSLFLFLSLFLCAPSSRCAADHLSNPLADPPKWKSLQKYQRTITRDEFERLLRSVYCSQGINDEFIRLDRDFACILMDRDAQTWFTLRFAKDGRRRRLGPRPWRTAQSLPRQKRKGALAGLKIALDPGHIGGEWAKMEERWFQARRRPAGRGRGDDLAGGENARAETSGPGRARFFRARQDRAGDTASARRSQGRRPRSAKSGWNGKSARGFRRSGRPAERANRPVAE